MKHFIKRQKQMSERLNTLALLYRYSTLRFADNIQSQSINGKQSYTYSSFRTRCDAISEMLENQGIGFGDRVAILSGNNPNWGIAFFAATAYCGRHSEEGWDFSESEEQNSTYLRKNS